MKHILLCLTMSCCFMASAQSGKICFIRSTGYVASAVNFRVYIDDTLVCKLKNKSYSVHTVSPGKHTVAASNTGFGGGKKSSPFTVVVVEGKVTYVNVVWADSVTAEEVTENTGTQKIKKMTINTKCSTDEASE
jgi:hypothetical protein